MKKMHLVRTLFLLAGVWLTSLPAFADAVFETLKGDVRVVNPSGALAIPVRGQSVDAGASVTTGTDGQALLRFDDGQAILLNPGSEFKITAYKFDRGQPAGDSIAFDLLRGALRSVSGLIGSRNPRAYALRVPQATIGIRGTDFSAVTANQSSYLSVQSGTISVGDTTFTAGSFGTVSSGGVATSITAGALPAGVSESFGSLSSVTVSAATTGAGAAGGGAASGAAAGGGVAGGVVAAGVAAAAALAAGGSTNQTPTTGTTGTTGTR
jgi:hypothetical protein